MADKQPSQELTALDARSRLDHMITSLLMSEARLLMVLNGNADPVRTAETVLTELRSARQHAEADYS
jgi:hypothetical protein